MSEKKTERKQIDKTLPYPIYIIAGYNRCAYVEEDRELVDEIDNWDTEKHLMMFVRNITYMYLVDIKDKYKGNYNDLNICIHYGLLIRFADKLFNKLHINGYELIKNIRKLLYNNLVFLLNDINPIKEEQSISKLNLNFENCINKSIFDLYQKENNSIKPYKLINQNQIDPFPKEKTNNSRQIEEKEFINKLNDWSDKYEHVYSKVTNTDYFKSLPNAIIEYDWDTRFLYLNVHFMIQHIWGKNIDIIYKSPLIYSYGELVSKTLSILNELGFVDDYNAIKNIPNFFIRLYDYLVLGLGARYKLNDVDLNMAQFQGWYRLRAYNFLEGESEEHVLDPNDIAILDVTYKCFYNDRANEKGNSGDFEGAILDFNESIKLHPNEPLLYTQRAIAKKFLGDKKGVIDDYTKAIEVNRHVFYFYNLYLERGLNKFLNEDDLGAIEDYTKAIEYNNKKALVYSRRGYVKDYIGDYEGALNDINTAIKLDPKNPEIISSYLLRGKYICGNRCKGYKIDQAVQDFDTAVLFCTENELNETVTAEAHFNRGLLITCLEGIDKSEALPDLKKAASLGNDRAAKLIDEITNAS